MADEQVIRDAWQRAPKWDFDRRGDLLVPARPILPAHAVPNHEDPVNEPVKVVRFHHERGVYDGRPARRVVGFYGSASAQVAFAFTDD